MGCTSSKPAAKNGGLASERSTKIANDPSKVQTRPDCHLVMPAGANGWHLRSHKYPLLRCCLLPAEDCAVLGTFFSRMAPVLFGLLA